MEVMIFERSEEIARRIVDQISESNVGLNFSIATSYDDALISFDSEKPFVVLLDLNFDPDAAINLLRYIKQSEHQSVAIIWYTQADEACLRFCKQLGADYIFDKYDEFEKIPAVILEARQRLS